MSIKQIMLITIAGVYLFALTGCSAKEFSSKIDIVNFDQLEPLYTKSDNVLYVVNFWATWCAPCVKELPHFMEVNKKYKQNPNFKMILVSLDDSQRVDDSVKQFVSNMQLDAELYLLDDIKRMNEWIPAVDSSWGGAIPATLFIKNGKSLKFFPSAITKEELEETVLKFINN